METTGPDPQTLARACQALAKAGDILRGRQAFLGLDGFVDEIIQVVDRRLGPERFVPIRRIGQLAQRVGAAAGVSTNLELVPRRVKVGGNGPIFAAALAGLGVAVTYAGAVGDGQAHPVFADLGARVRLIGLADPGHTDALEFEDGKIMLGKLETLKEVTWERLVSRVGRAELVSLLKGADLVGLVNWTMLPHMTAIWRRLQAEALPELPRRTPAPLFFADLADPQKRSLEDLRAGIETLRGFTPYFHTILGLNRAEAAQVAAALGLPQVSSLTTPLPAVTRALGEALGLGAVVVHPVDGAAVWTGGQTAHVRGPYTPSPRLTTGAGDNFNVGFCLGQLLRVDPAACLVLAVGTSGFYVREQRSPGPEELLVFLQRWGRGEV